MRKIKFRFWDEKREIMHHEVTLLGLHWESDGNPPVYIGDNTFDYGDGRTVPRYSNGAVMQFTGLNDSTGKEGYHKDLWQLHGVVYTVEWDRMDAMFYLKHPDRNAGPDDHINMAHFKFGEIIGNIYENPELIEVNDHARTP